MSKFRQNSKDVGTMGFGCTLSILSEIFIPSFTVAPLLFSVSDLILFFFFLFINLREIFNKNKGTINHNILFTFLGLLYLALVSILITTAFSNPFAFCIANNVKDISIPITIGGFIFGSFFLVSAFIYGSRKMNYDYKKITPGLLLENTFEIFFFSSITSGINFHLIFYEPKYELALLISEILTTVIFSIAFLFFSWDYKEDYYTDEKDTFLDDFSMLTFQKHVGYTLILLPLGGIITYFSIFTTHDLRIYIDILVEYLILDNYLPILNLIIYILGVLMYLLLIGLSIHSIRILFRKKCGKKYSVSLFELPTSTLIILSYIFYLSWLYFNFSYLLFIISMGLTLFFLILSILVDKTKSASKYEFRFIIILILVLSRILLRSLSANITDLLIIIQIWRMQHIFIFSFLVPAITIALHAYTKKRVSIY